MTGRKLPHIQPPSWWWGDPCPTLAGGRMGPMTLQSQKPHESEQTGTGKWNLLTQDSEAGESSKEEGRWDLVCPCWKSPSTFPQRSWTCSFLPTSQLLQAFPSTVTWYPSSKFLFCLGWPEALYLATKILNDKNNRILKCEDRQGGIYQWKELRILKTERRYARGPHEDRECPVCLNGAGDAGRGP